MKIEVADSGNVPDTQVVTIFVVVTDASAPELEPMTLTQFYNVQRDRFQTEAEVVTWLYARVEDVLLHEVAEFFTFDGAVLRPPKHPLTDELRNRG